MSRHVIDSAFELARDDRATLLDALRAMQATAEKHRDWYATEVARQVALKVEAQNERDEARAQLAQAQERLAACEPVIEAVRRKVREAEAMAGEPLYFIQDARTWHGDMIVFWGMNGNGYVVDIMQAGLYPAAHSVGSRDSDLYWRPEDLLGSLTTCANSERLNGKKAQKKPLPPKKGPTP